MAVEACVKQTLCPLQGSVLNAFAGIVDTTIATLQAEVTLLTATLLAIQPQKVAITALRDTALTALNAAQVPLNLVPLNLVAGCAGLGATMGGINSGFDTLRADVGRIVNEANRYLTYDAFLTEKRDALNATIADLLEVRTAIGECL